MKKTLLILLFSISSFAFSQNYQGYVPFPTAAVWIEDSGPWSNGICFNNVYTIINEDTLINGLTYYKVNLKHTNYSSTSGQCRPWHAQVTRSVFGYLRNDSANKKVWLRYPTSNQDTLFYDFDLSVGDTIGNGDFFMSPQFHQIVVDSVDTVYLDSQYRRKIYFSSQCDPSLNFFIEGIGSGTGFAFPLESCYCPLAGVFCNLECMGDSVGAIYPDTTASCRLITNLSKQDVNQIKHELYPNPTSGKVNLTFEKSLQSIEIYNLQGQKVQEINPKNRSWELPQQIGLYLIRIQDEEGRIHTEKIIKK